MTIEDWKPGEYRKIGRELWGLCVCGKVVRAKRLLGTLHLCGRRL